jgi:hypothetical protein
MGYVTGTNTDDLILKFIHIGYQGSQRCERDETAMNFDGKRGDGK